MITTYPIVQKDYDTEVSMGRVSGVDKVNKFGRSTDVDNGVATDIWDRANATDTQTTWTAPTQARIHDIVSTDANDDGSPVGTGARTLMVAGLTDWSTDEVEESITLNGITNVATVNSYVIIHRMWVTTKGASGPNVGVITATAQTDATVTAQINAGEGQTQMAIYGVPSTKKIVIPGYYASTNRATAGVVDIKFLLNSEPDAELTAYVTKHTFSVNSAGTGVHRHPFKPYKSFAGPCLIKLEGFVDDVVLDNHQVMLKTHLWYW